VTTLCQRYRLQGGANALEGRGLGERARLIQSQL
jgi:hypothetical protein